MASGCACLCAAKQSASTLNCKYIFYVTYRHFSLYWKSVYKAEHPSPSINCKTILPPHNLIQPSPILCSYLLQPIQMSSICSCAFNNDFFQRNLSPFFTLPKKTWNKPVFVWTSYMGLFTVGSHLFLPQSSKGDRPTPLPQQVLGRSHWVIKGWGAPQRPNPVPYSLPKPLSSLSPCPAMASSPRLTPTQRPPQPPPHREGTHQPHSLPQAEGTPLRPKPLSSTRTRACGSPGGGRGWQDPLPPQQLPPPRKRREAGRAAQKGGAHAHYQGPWARRSGTCGGGRARRAGPALNSFQPHLPSSIFILLFYRNGLHFSFGQQKVRKGGRSEGCRLWPGA